MALWTFLAAHFAIAFFLSSGIVGIPTRTATAPKQSATEASWRVDLHSVIGSAPLPYLFPSKYETKGWPVISLWFTEDNTIAATFVTATGKPELSIRSNDTHLPMRLRAVFLDAATGKVTGTSEWPTDSRTSTIVAAHDGMFVTKTGSELILNSRAVKNIKKLDLKTGSWVGYSSPSGKHVLLIGQDSPGSKVPWAWLDVDNLKVVREWEQIQSGWVSISDHKIAMTTCVWVHNCDRVVQVMDINSTWKLVISSDRQHDPYPQFINDDLLVLRDFPSRLKLITAGGDEVLTEDMGQESKRQGWGRAYVSANGERFIIPVDVIKGRIAALDVGGHGVLKKLLIYDAPFKSRSYTLELKPSIKEGNTLFALSPDGSRLAILNNEMVELINLPNGVEIEPGAVQYAHPGTSGFH